MMDFNLSEIVVEQQKKLFEKKLAKKQRQAEQRRIRKEKNSGRRTAKGN